MADISQMQDPDYRPPMREAVPLGIQHVLAMFAGNITVPLIIALAAAALIGCVYRNHRRPSPTS